MLVKLARRPRDDGGSMLVSVMIIMLVLSLGAMTLAVIVTNTTGILVGARTTVQSRAAADAGLAAGIAQAASGASLCSMSLTSSSAPRYSVTSACTGGKVTITSIGRGADGGTTKTQAVYELDVAETTLDGALVSANGGLNVSSIYVTAIDIDGDIVLNYGNLDCNNSTEISGDVIVRSGTVSLSNYCKIHGDVIVSGNLTISNNVSIGGDVYTMGNLTMNNSGAVAGNAYVRGTASLTSGAKIAKDLTAVGTVSVDGSTTKVTGGVNAGGAVTVNSATVGGAVVSANVNDSSFYGAKVGAIRVAGRVMSLQSATVTGSVVSTKAGVSQQIAPDVTIGGDLILAGTYTTWSSGPTVIGVKQQNVTGLVAPTAPTVDTPWPLTSSAFVWSDLPFNEAAWGGAGFGLISTPTCDFQNNPTHVTTINNLTTPTIVDARSCSQVKMYNVTFNLKTDVTFLVSNLDGQLLKIKSADGNPHLFNLITPDETVNQAATCTNGSWKIKIDDVLMNTLITGVAYSPCTVHLGQSGSNPSGWNGQVYAGTVTWGGNSSSRMELAYREVNIPGLVTNAAGGGAGGAASGIGDLLSLRDVP